MKKTNAPGMSTSEIVAFTTVVGPVGVSVLVATPAASIVDVALASTPLPEVTLQKTVPPTSATPLGDVTRTLRGSGSGVLIVPT